VSVVSPVPRVWTWLFTQQIPQIGIMKAIGARPGNIGRLYLAMTLLVAMAAALLAMVPAVLLGHLAVGTFLGFLGIEPVSLAAPWWTYVVLLAVGLCLPPLKALVPLVKASRTTVRAAIDHHGGGSKPRAAAGVLTRLSRISRLDRGLLMALRNIVRRPARFLLSVGPLASAGTVFVAGMSLSSGTDAIAEEEKERRGWDVDVQLAAPASTEQVNSGDQPGAGRQQSGGPERHTDRRCRARTDPRHPHLSRPRTRPGRGDRTSDRPHHVHTAEAAGGPLTAARRDRVGRAQPADTPQHRPRRSCR
jgi:hypothetical protein